MSITKLFERCVLMFALSIVQVFAVIAEGVLRLCVEASRRLNAEDEKIRKSSAKKKEAKAWDVPV